MQKRHLSLMTRDATLVLGWLLFFVPLLPAQQDTLPLSDVQIYDAIKKRAEDLFSSGDFNGALVVSKQMLEMAKTTFGPKSPNYGYSLNSIGVVLHHVGQLREARAYLEASIAHAKENQSNESDLEAIRLSNLGMLLKDMGELGRAVYYVQESFDLGKRVWPEGSPEYGTVVHNLSLLYANLGQYDKAKDYAYQSLYSTEKAVGKKHLKYTFRLANIANILNNTGQTTEALAVYPEILSIMRAINNEKHLLYAITLRNMGRAYITLEDFASALPFLITARDSILNRYGDSHPQYIRVLSSLGWTQHKLKQRAEAEASLTTAYHHYQISRKLDSSNLLLLISRLGAFYESQDDLQKATEYYLQLASAMKYIIQYELQHLSEWGQRTWLEKLASKKNIFMSFVYRHPESTELREIAADLSLLFRQLTLNNQRALLAKVTQSEDTLVINTYEAWKIAHKDLGKALSLPKNKQPEDLDEKREQLLLLERKLAKLSYDFKATLNSRVRWQAIGQSLAPAAAVLDFFTFNYVNKNFELTDSVYYGAWLISAKTTTPVWVSLFEEKAAGNTRRTRQLYAPETISDQANWKQLIWEPLQAHLNEVNTIYYTTAGILHMVNIAAVPVDHQRVMGDQFALYQLSKLKQLEDTNQPESQITAKALLLGGLRYELNSTAENEAIPKSNTRNDETTASFRNWNEQDWNYLSWTKEEVTEIASCLEKADWQVDLYTEDQGTEAVFKATCTQDPSPRLIHLATHAFYFSKPKDDDSEIGFKVASNPLLRSGLILTGGNSAWQGELTTTEAEDGILTAYEISQFNLKQTELVVLSACNTGQGEIVGSEGVYGLQRAFKAAGAKYILMSLWGVDDRKTYEFMQFFYQFWQDKGKDIPTAYQATQQAMRSKYSNPFNPQAWAGFILVE